MIENLETGSKKEDKRDTTQRNWWPQELECSKHNEIKLILSSTSYIKVTKLLQQAGFINS